MCKEVSQNSMTEFANMFIKSIDVENINLRTLIVDSGLSKEAVKDLLSELVERYSENPDKPSIKISGNKSEYIKNTLVKTYNLTYSIANRLIDMYNIEFPEQLKYLSDDELKAVTGVGVSTLKKIRDAFPYTEPPKTTIVNTSITNLYLPTKIEELLRNNSVLYVKQLGTFIEEDIDNVGYPRCLIITKAYELYENEVTDRNIYNREYLNIMIQSYNRNLNNLVRHSDSKLNLHWVNDSIYHFVTFVFEIMFNQPELETSIKTAWDIFNEQRELVLSKLYIDDTLPNTDIIKHYSSLCTNMLSVLKIFDDEI